MLQKKLLFLLLLEVAKNQQGKEVLGFQSKFTINRLDYNIKYDPTGAGVAKDVDIDLYFELIKQ
jgi:polyisoprenoid-binding protein YceI